MTKEILDIDMGGVMVDCESAFSRLNRGSFLIDDRPRNGAAEFAEHNPGGEWIEFSPARFPDRPSIVDCLKEQA